MLHIVDHDALSIALAMTSYLDAKNNFKSNYKEIMKKKWDDQARRLVFFIKRIIKNDHRNY